MSGAAQRNETRDERLETIEFGSSGGASPTALKQLAAERLEAHRKRRAALQARDLEMREKVQVRRESVMSESRRGAERVREAVAARYEHSPTYREFLAAEAERALQQAQAEAEVAARRARAMAEAQMELMADLAQWSEPEPREPVTANQPAGTGHGGLKVQMLEDLAAAPRPPASRMVAHRGGVELQTVLEEAQAEIAELEHEIAFRLSPQIAEYSFETQDIPGNIIEFPRQLVAPRKARPRLAEGPLREEAPPEPQLRIFEVEPEQISVQPAAPEPSAAAEWQSLYLEAESDIQPGDTAAAPTIAVAPQAASLERRAMAAAVDGCCLGAGMVVFAVVAVALTGQGMRGLALPRLAAAGGITAVVLWVVYQLLFFSLNEATPGMRYARVAMCTLGDENPTRKALRLRVLATLLAACPLGLGLWWMAMDDDRLGWHDRISRVYLRSY